MPSNPARAAVFSGPTEGFDVREVDLPEPGPGEAIVRTSCCTLCRSDLHTFEGRREAPTPTTLGHEVLGHISALHADDPPRDVTGQPLSKGDRVTWSIAVHCGTCYFCEQGLPQKCADLFKYGHAPVDGGRGPSGGLATHLHLRAGTSYVRVPQTLSDAVACPANCATATAVAALRLSGGVAGKTVLVQGAGMLGLNACALANTGGAATVIAVDREPRARARALSFGAHHALGLLPPEELAEEVRAVSDGRGADVAVEMTGAPEAVEAGLAALRTGGTQIWVGSVMPTRSVALDPETVTRRMLTVRGLHNYTPDDLVAAIEFLTQAVDRYPFEGLVGDVFELGDVAAAFQRALSAESPRIAVRP